MSNNQEEAKPDEANEGEEDQQMDNDGEGEPEQDPDDPEAENEGEDDVPVYVEKDFSARVPYNSEFKDDNINEVLNMEAKNTRKTFKVRISRRRAEFHSDAYNFVEREPAENPQELKPKKITSLIQNKMVLDIGLQAARPMKTFCAQTYHNRSVNLSAEYNPKDFISNMPDIDKNNTEGMNKMEKFFEKVAPRIEEALQSNELINVFQDDFEMLGDKKNRSEKIANQSSEPLPFSDIDHGKNKSVSCIAFHPKRPYIVALSFLENITFDERAEVSGKSYDTSVLVLNFADHHIMLMYVLHTTIEITTIEFHPDYPNLLFGGCLTGQIIVWDFKDETTKIIADDEANPDEASAAKSKDDDESHDKATQSVIELKQACSSMIVYSHRTHVCDLKFIPAGIKVDKKRPSEGEVTHFISCAEDGNVLIWDSRTVFREHRDQSYDEVHWKPFLTIPLFRPDGSGEQGLSKILFKKDCVDTVFWAGSDEGDLIFVDWSKRPSGKEDDQAQKADFMISREGQRNYRPVLALEQSPFFEELIMTVHDFNF